MLLELQVLIVLLVIREATYLNVKLIYPNVFAEYFYMFSIVWGVTYWIAKDTVIATFLALCGVSLRAIYRYILGMHKSRTKNRDRLAFVMMMIGIMVGAHALKGKGGNRVLHWIVYVGLVYWLASLEEWVLHRYVMHCYQNWPWLDKLQTTVWPFTHMKRACTVHKDHHVSVAPDMTLNEVKNERELFFNWEVTMVTFASFLPVAAGVAYMLDLGVPGWVGAVGVGACFALVFAFVWNSVHPSMHHYKLPIGIGKGVPNVAWKLDKNGLYHRNHEVHHQVKGAEKGNFNVVFLGMDEVMGTNRL